MNLKINQTPMGQKTYYFVTGGIFLIIAVLHLLRVVNGWPATVGTFTVPMWFSLVAVIFTGYLSYNGLKRR